MSDGTIGNELTTLVALLNWGAMFRLSGRRLLLANLRAADVLPSREQMTIALAAIGAPIG